MATYDSTVIQQHADQLYGHASITILLYSAVGAIGAGGTAFMISGKLELTALLATGIGAAIGYGLGLQRAFALKLQAQIALCQAQIEANTRGLSRQGQRSTAAGDPAVVASDELRSHHQGVGEKRSSTTPQGDDAVLLASTRKCPRCGSAWTEERVEGFFCRQCTLLWRDPGRVSASSEVDGVVVPPPAPCSHERVFVTPANNRYCEVCRALLGPA